MLDVTRMNNVKAPMAMNHALSGDTRLVAKPVPPPPPAASVAPAVSAVTLVEAKPVRELF